MTPIEFCRWCEGYVALLNTFSTPDLSDLDELLDAVVTKSKAVTAYRLEGAKELAAYAFYVWVQDCRHSIDVHKKLQAKLKKTIEVLDQHVSTEYTSTVVCHNGTSFTI